MKKNKKDVLVITIMVLVLIIGITYAYFKIVKETSFNMSIYDFDITFNDGSLINDKNLYPIEEEKIATEGIKKEFTMAKKNETDKDVYTKISLVDIELDSDARDKDLRWRLLKNNVLLTEGSFVNLRDNNKLELATNIKLTTTKLDSYTLYIWIQETNYPQRESLMNKSIKAKIEVEGMLTEYDGIPNEGKLDNGMIPVVYDEASDKWIKAGGSLGWYDYDKQMWANAVTVYPDHRNEYMESKIGTEVKMEDISTMWVWIPRYKYRIPESIGRGTTTPPEIDVVFENGTEATGVDEQTYETGIKSDGTNENYYTHPSFRNGAVVKNKEPYDIGGWDEELTGIWVGKFETGGTTTEPIIKPNIISLISSVEDSFTESLIFSGGTFDKDSGIVEYNGNNVYGLSNDVESHMIKNTEWGMVAYLSQSKYGKMGNKNYDISNKEIYINNSSTDYTGRSIGISTPNSTRDQYTSSGSYSYNNYLCENDDTVNCTGDKKNYSGVGASTTGTIYGIYDMVGGKYDFVMGTCSTSGFLNHLSKKYYDSYKCNSDALEKEKIIMGDALWETKGWYNDNYNLPSNWWFIRGGADDSTYNRGIFFSGLNSGYNVLITFRSILIK